MIKVDPKEKLVVVTSVDSRELVVAIYTRSRFKATFREEWTGLEPDDPAWDEFGPDMILAHCEAFGSWYEGEITVSLSTVDRGR